MFVLCFCVFFFFFKQKTAYEMRISDWSSDVCSSDLVGAGEPLRILVPGNIGVHKGSGLIAQIKQLDTSGQLQFHLLGTGDSDLKDCVVDNGAYERTQFAELAGAIKPHIAVVLSIVPETWCHTLTESWATGIPVFGIDRGAVGDRIRERSEEHTSELKSLMRISYAVFCLKKK